MGRSIWPSSIALIVFGWTGYARLLRGDILATKERDYVMAARASGASDIRLIMRHVLPNAIIPYAGSFVAGYGLHCVELRGA